MRGDIFFLVLRRQDRVYVYLNANAHSDLLSYNSRLLHVGCGTSEVGPCLASEPDLDLHVTDADSSPSAVRLMKRRHTGLENYVCHETNVLNLPFPDGSYDAVVDKGTLDALLCRSAEDATGMAAEVHRVLCKGGVFLQVRGGGGRRTCHL